MRPFGDNYPLSVNDFEAAVNGRHPHPASRKRAMKLSTLVTLMLCSVIVSVLLVVYALYFVQIANVTREGVKDTAMAVARTLADEPEIKRAFDACREPKRYKTLPRRYNAETICCLSS
jgi:sensor histidine kinase regulating citrate/malate metabolism